MRFQRAAGPRPASWGTVLLQKARAPRAAGGRAVGGGRPRNRSPRELPARHAGRGAERSGSPPSPPRREGAGRGGARGGRSGPAASAPNLFISVPLGLRALGLPPAREGGGAWRWRARRTPHPAPPGAGESSRSSLPPPAFPPLRPSARSCRSGRTRCWGRRRPARGTGGGAVRAAGRARCAPAPAALRLRAPGRALARSRARRRREAAPRGGPAWPCPLSSPPRGPTTSEAAAPPAPSRVPSASLWKRARRREAARLRGGGPRAGPPAKCGSDTSRAWKLSDKTLDVELPPRRDLGAESRRRPRVSRAARRQVSGTLSRNWVFFLPLHPPDS